LGHPVIFGNQTDTLDWRMPELTAFYSVLALPHFAWSGVFAALGVALTLKAIDRGSIWLGLLAGLAWLGQASIHPRMPILMPGSVLALVAGVGVLAAILYRPEPAGALRRRFLDALSRPRVALAARGMYEAILPRLRSRRARRLIPFSYVAFAAIGSAFLALAPLAVAGQPQYVVTTAEYDGLKWLGAEPSGRVLAMPGVGLYIPAYSSDTVYDG